jgi:hypothetical protein
MMAKPEIHKTLRDLLCKRMDALAEDGGRTVCHDQRHLEEGTSERSYWHHGYASALKDVLGILQGTGDTVN